jgi:hypothetical protein
VAGVAVFGLLSGGVWLVNPAVVLPAGGGFGASTIPLTGGAVEGVGKELNGTEFVTGAVETVGETLLGLPNTLFDGCGILGGLDGAEVAVVVGAGAGV